MVRNYNTFDFPTFVFDQIIVYYIVSINGFFAQITFSYLL